MWEPWIYLCLAFLDAWPDLQAASENPRYQNPKLVALKGMILEAFERDPNTYAILFTKTKISTEVLRKWVNEDADMSWLRAVRLTGISGENNAGNYGFWQRAYASGGSGRTQCAPPKDTNSFVLTYKFQWRICYCIQSCFVHRMSLSSCTYSPSIMKSVNMTCIF